jgi:cholesterol oxidase
MTRRGPRTHSIGRRSFLARSAAGAAGLWLAGCSGGVTTPEPTGQVLVIGSGYGGSVAALRLVEAGITVTLLERGRRWDVSEAGDTFCSLRRADRRAVWLGERTSIGLVRSVPRYAGLAEAVEGETLGAIAGSGVGGGSLLSAGVLMEPDRELFGQVFPSELSWDEMSSTWFPRVREVLAPSRIPEDVLASETYAAMRVFAAHVEAAGLAPTYVDLAIDWDLVREEIEGARPPEAIYGDFVYGLNSGAKRSCDRTYLARAEATGLLDLRPLTNVRAIGRDPDGWWWAEVERIDELGEVLERARLRAPRMVLAAGTLGTARLLLRARAEGTIPDLPPAIGEGFGDNGQHILVRGSLTESVGAWQGGPSAVYLRHLDNPVAPIAIEHAPAAYGSDCHCVIHSSMGVPDALGSLSWDAAEDRVRIAWDPANAASAREAAVRSAEILNAASGGTVEGLPAMPPVPMTYHPLGGAVIGRATDLAGRVLGQDGLYVLDGSLVPGSTPAANPSLTIAALAERCIATIVAEDFASAS